MSMYEFFPFMNGEGADLRNLFIRCCQYKKIIKKGDNLRLYPQMHAFLSKGLLKIYMSNAAGNERLMWYIQEINAIPYNYSFDKRVVAEVDSEVLYIKREDYLDHIISSRGNLETYIERVNKRYFFCVQQVLNENIYSCNTKIYSFIYQFAKVLGKESENGQIVIENVPSRKDIASIVGTHRSNVTRYITELEKSGIVEKRKGLIIVKDLKALEQLIDQQEFND